MTATRSLLAAIAVAVVCLTVSNAEIPAGYKGLPFPPGSAPRELNGRINFNEYDLGGANVAWYADDAWGGALNRKNIDAAGPAFFGTNGNTTDRDTFYADGVMWPNGVRYPDPVDTSVQDIYIGASHPSNFTKWTVHVSKAGKYWISSYWSAMDGTMAFTINLLNGTKTATTGLVSIKSVTQSYHAWRRYPDCASIEADTGVQVLHFQNGSMHLNQDFLYFSADSGKFPTDVRQPTMKPVKSVTPALFFSQNTVRFTLHDAGMTKIALFDCIGREVAQVLNKTMPAGTHSAAVNMANVRQGVYFLRLEHNNASSVVKFQKSK
jgi:hypothetical protein